MVRSLEGGQAETVEETQRREFFEGVLDAPQVLPVGEVPIVKYIELLDETAEDIPVYAWHGTRDLVVDVRRTRRDTKGPVVGLELCSSTPIATAHSTAREFDHCGVKARGIEQAFTTTEGIRQLRYDDEELVPVAQALARRKDARALMVAAVQRTLFELTPEQYNDATVLRERLRHNLVFQQCLYRKAVTQDDDGIEAGWKLRFEYEDTDFSYFELFSLLRVPTDAAKHARKRLLEPEGEENISALHQEAQEVQPLEDELALRYIDYQADVIARLVANNPDFRIARFLSMDMLDPDTIASHSVAKMPRSTQSMHLFSRAIASLFNPRQHIQGDIRSELPVPDNSLTFIVSFDGWRPIEHRESRRRGELSREVDEAVMALSGLYQKLKPGGQLVIFPWVEAQASTAERRALDRVKLRLADCIHHGVDTRTFHENTIEAWMTPGDRALSDVGASMPKGKGSQTYEALIVTKLAKNMANRPARNEDKAERARSRTVGVVGGLATSQVQNQD